MSSTTATTNPEFTFNKFITGVATEDAIIQNTTTTNRISEFEGNLLSEFFSGHCQYW